MNKNWERLGRSTIYNSKFLSVYSDKVQLPNKTIIDDYTVVKKPDGVIIVATDKENKLICFYEYKYAVDMTLLTLPAGSLDDGEDPIQTAKRELIEETGFTAESFRLVTSLFSYPSKDSHQFHVVRAENAYKIENTKHEPTENIGDILFLDKVDIKKVMEKSSWHATEIISALYVCQLL